MKELNRILEPELPAPRKGLVGAWREVLPALVRRHREPSWFLDVPVPETNPAVH